MNLFYDLPYDIRFHIFSFVKIFSVNIIIKSWRRYYHFKKFIFDTVYKSPAYLSDLDCQLMFNISHPFTLFYFKIFTNIITGNESYFPSIYFLIYSFAVSIDDHQFNFDYNNNTFFLNKFYCTSIANKFNWNSILNIID